MDFLDEEFLRRLENLRFIVKGRFRGQIGGSHYSPRSGVSLEFADYRNYFPGDDLRYVDWNIYGRLDRLFIKVFSREEDIPIYLLLDVSRSMTIEGKLQYGAKLAAALSYLGLKHLNRVGVFPFSETLREGVRPRHGTAQIFKIFDYLKAISPAGETALNASLEEFVRRHVESGLAVIVSDFLSEDGSEEGLAHLLYKRFDVVALQILAEADLSPQIDGDMRLEDVEDDTQHLTLAVGDRTRNLYVQALSEHLERLRRFCLERGIEHLVLPTSIPLEQAVFEYLKRGTFIK
ncbi:MAG: DUF58 domain-containing protein [Candidatus Bipolaricaulia bacterium]